MESEALKTGKLKSGGVNRPGTLQQTRQPRSWRIVFARNRQKRPIFNFRDPYPRFAFPLNHGVLHKLCTTSLSALMSTTDGNSKGSRRKRKARPQIKKKSRRKKVPKFLPKTVDELGGTFATLAEVAAVLRISPMKVNLLIADGALSVIDVAGTDTRKHCYRILTASLREFINSKRKAGLAW